MALPGLAAGIAITFSVPPFGLWPVGIAGIALLYATLRGLPLRLRCLAGGCAGVGLYGPSLWWATGFSGPGYVALVVVSTAFWVVAAGAVPATRGRALAFPAAFTLAAALRSVWPLGGFPVGGPALGQAGGPLLGSARVGGWLLVVAAAFVAGVMVAGAADLARTVTRPRPPLDLRPPGTLSGAAAGTAWAAGFLVLVAVLTAASPDGGPPVAHLRVAAVQGGGLRGLRAIEVSPARAYRAQLAASTRLRRPLGLVLWPEDVIALGRPLAGSPEEAAVGRLARRLDATVVAGVTEDVGSHLFRNRAVAWAPTGTVVGSYEKVHRVPFGEYVPLRGLVRHLADLADVPRDAIAGHGPAILRTPAGPLVVLVSYEVFFPARSRSGLAAGGQLVVVPTNTSSYSTGQIPAQELAASRLRAVEAGRDLVQASPTGYSAVMDSSGTVRALSSLGSRQVVGATVARRNGVTWYARLGDWPFAGLAAACVVAGWYLALAAGRRQAPTPAAGRRRPLVSLAPVPGLRGLGAGREPWARPRTGH